MINGTFLINLFITFICFIVPAVIYNFAVDRNTFLFKRTPFMPICLTVATASLLSYLIGSTFYCCHVNLFHYSKRKIS